MDSGRGSISGILKKEEVIVSIEYKYLCLQILYRSMKMNKYEKLLLGYLIMRADKEAFTYFQSKD